MDFNRCYGCMRELNAPACVCPHCGYDNTNGPASQPSHVLPCGTVLNGQYVVGRSLGQGGFGITYIGYDLNLEFPVCIKEYYPEGSAMRSATQSSMVYWGTSENAQELKDRRKSFVREAQRAVKLRDLSHVVTVWGVFYENETAYIVMDYIEGETLKNRLIRTQKPLGEKDCIALLTPVMEDLEKAHKRGIIHRDIKPDNIMLDAQGEPILLDMGAAKDLGKAAQGGSSSSTMVVSQGFSPLEQYRQNGSIGSWTDVYAMCATIYYCVTGKLLSSPVDRMMEDNMNLSGLSPAFAAVLKKGLAVKVEDRIQTMSELLAALTEELPKPEPPKPPKPEPPKPEPPKPEPAKKKRGSLIAGAAAALIIAAGAGYFLPRMQTPVVTETPIPIVTEAPTPEPTPIPTPEPTLKPTPSPTVTPTPTPEPTMEPTPTPTPEPTPTQTSAPTASIDWSLDEATGTLTITGSGTMEDYTSGQHAPWYDSSELIKTVILDSGITSIGNWAFSHCASLENITIPDSVTSIGDYAFFYCSHLTGITVSSHVTNIGYGVFSACNSLMSISVDENNPNFIEIDGALYTHDRKTLLACPLGKVTGSFTVPNGVTGIGDHAFYHCDRLTNVEIPSSVVSIGDLAFAYCDLNSITLPSSITDIGTGAFYSCDKLTSITIPSSVTSVGNGAFSDCNKLTSINIDKNNSSFTAIDGVLYSYDLNTLLDFPAGSSIDRFDVPDGVKNIASQAFANCKDLASITIPDSVSRIGSSAFMWCDNLTDVYYTGTETQWTDIRIDTNNAPLINATMHFNAEVQEQEDNNTAGSASLSDNEQGKTLNVPHYHSISAGDTHTLGLYEDGTVVSVGKMTEQRNVFDWKDIVSVAAGRDTSFGIKTDGTVIARGDNSSGQRRVSDWTDIVAIAASESHTIGVRADGTVVGTGQNGFNQCDVSSWTDIVDVAVGHFHTVGLRADGTVVATGQNSYKQCDVGDWTDIVAICAGDYHTVGVRRDGTVVATGWNEVGQCDVGDWTDIIQVSAGKEHTVGLKSDGTVVFAGWNKSGRGDVTGWTDIVEISAGESFTVGLKKDGTAVSAGAGSNGDVRDWKNIKVI